MPRPLALLPAATAALALAASLAAAAPAAAAPAAPAAAAAAARPHVGVRLLVTDATAGRAHVLDAATGRVAGRFSLAGRATAWAGGDGLGYLSQPDAGRTDVLDAARPVPALLGHGLDGARPVHVTVHDGRVAVFDDATGRATVTEEASLRWRQPRTRTHVTQPHHGVAVPLGELALVSATRGGDDHAAGVEVRDARDRRVQPLLPCPHLHGEAAVGEVVAFGCEDGLLLVEGHGDHVHSARVALPAGTPEGARPAHLAAADGVPFLVADLGGRHLLRVDPHEGRARAWRLPAPEAAFALSPVRGGTTVVLGEDGRLRTHDARGRVRTTTRVAAPLAAGAAAPGLAVHGDRAWVADPAAGRVVEVAVGTGRVVARHRVAGAPRSVAVLAPHAG